MKKQNRLIKILEDWTFLHLISFTMFAILCIMCLFIPELIPTMFVALANYLVCHIVLTEKRLIKKIDNPLWIKKIQNKNGRKTRKRK